MAGLVQIIRDTLDKVSPNVTREGGFFPKCHKIDLDRFKNGNFSSNNTWHSRGYRKVSQNVTRGGDTLGDKGECHKCHTGKGDKPMSHLTFFEIF